MFDKFRAAGVEWLVVFLGNPGPKYAGTRHNAGFMAAEHMEKALDVKINRLRFKALTAQAKLGGAKVLLMKPQTYMNLSGEAVSQAAKFYKIPPEKVIVISDDISLPVGALRVKRKGSAGGHNGLKSIIACLGSDNFPRIKVGVGSPEHPEHEMIDWVLGVPRGKDWELFNEGTKRAADAAECYIANGPDITMNRFN